ncbi:hypothetical protein PR003_g5177 [Phytophthora rubi]|uniref:Uncharacterized protein n=1 Tax=Phytophthora rubi TaxID=129364 RepID=A0A6A4G086_9STRA|nr:hypothetical protein PR003_g5177 [Phytophthora rubi]
MLTAMHLPNSLRGEALLHLVATLTRLLTKPHGLVSPHQKLFKTEPALDDQRTWGCIAHWQPYRLDHVTAQVGMARDGNVTFHEEYTTDGTYVQHLMQNAFADGDQKLRETVPVVRIKRSMDTYLPDRTAPSTSATKQLDIVTLEGQPAEHVQSSVDCQQNADLPACDGVGSAAASPADLRDPAKAPDSLAKATTDMQMPTTYTQARPTKFWPQWRAVMLAELQSLKDHMTLRLVPRTDTKKTKVIT